jgi:serine/threonine protein phosphatase PrpC
VALRIAEKAALSDVGRARQSNEDSYLDRSPLFVVADGMGGARAGEVASAIAVETAKTSEVGSRPEEDLAEVVKSANREIYRKAQADAEHAGMGTTFTAALVSGGEVAIGHVGDSRMYRLRDGELERLTQDHSLVEEFVRQGKLTPEEAEVHPQRSIITRALGPEPDVQVDTLTYPARPGDIYLICSDGLTGMVSEDQIAEIISAGESLADAAKRLIDAANENGGRDNITVILFRLESDDGADEGSDTLGDEATSAGVSAESVRAAVAEAEPSPRPTATASARSAVEGGVPASSPLAPRRGPAVAPRRRIFAAVGTVLVLVAVVAVVWVVDRQFWFVGTTDTGQVALYRGLPYELPLGIKMYSRQRVSSIPATNLQGRQRQYVLDHHARGRGDSADLFEQIDSGSSASP